MQRLPILAFVALAALASAAPVAAAPGKLAGLKRIAVVAYEKGGGAGPNARSAASRIETLLGDNGITVLDQQKADELKNVWKKLEDPGYFVTADEFVANANKFKIDGLLRVYVTADVGPGFGDTFSATAQADLRLVREDAKVESFNTVPMGVPGSPPSDGLTASAALINAVQRAVDAAAVGFGMEVADYTTPRTFKFELKEAAASADGIAPRRAAPSQPLEMYALLSPKKMLRESVTCRDADPSGRLGVVGGYLKQLGGNLAYYGSRLHVVDVQEQKEVLVFDTALVDRKHSYEKGTKQLLDCMFLGNWRYIVALTGNHLSLWDTERGLKMSEIALTEGLEAGSLAVASSQGRTALVVRGGGGAVYRRFEVARASGAP
jgi:hypothetical protein